MKVLLKTLVLATVLTLTVSAQALAWHVTGIVSCAENGAPLEGVAVEVHSTDGGTPFAETSVTDVNGEYNVWLPQTPRCYVATVTLGAGESPVDPAGGTFAFCTTNELNGIFRSFTISSPRCGGTQEEGVCWLTGGGNQFVSLVGLDLGESSNKHNWGGNVNPSCSSVPGDGGNWNHIAQLQKLHFQGTSIRVVRCGNVDDIPPGSTSPPTPFNFIEFTGSGRLVGFKGNHADYPVVYFFARAEDRNEPGSYGVDDGALKDRYFLHVYSNPADPAGSTLLLVDGDGDPTTVDPLPILHGNMQIHVSSCDGITVGGGDMGVRGKSPSGGDKLKGGDQNPLAGGNLSEEPSANEFVWLAAPMPNPAVNASWMRFGLPNPAAVSISVHDVAGRSIRRLDYGSMTAGEHTLVWDLRDDAGVPVARGLYYVRIATGGRAWSKPIAVIH
jgi:hypothetical protein